MEKKNSLLDDLLDYHGYFGQGMRTKSKVEQDNQDAMDMAKLNDPNRPIGQQLDYITDSYKPSNNLSLEEQNQDIVKSMGLMPESITPSIPMSKIDQDIEEEMNAAEQFQPNEIPQDIVQQMEAPAPAIPPQAATQAPEEITNKLISEYAEAARQSAQNKRDVAANEGITRMLQSLVGYGYSTAPSKAGDFSKAYDLAEAPLDELEARDKGQAVKQKLEASELSLDQTKQMYNPNSDVSQMARDKYAAVFRNMGRQDLADKIMEKNMSAAQLDNLFKAYDRVDAKASTSQVLSAMDKEDIKEQKQIKKENRKTKKEIETSLDNAKNALQELKEVKETFEKYSRNSMGGTGPIATAMGGTKFISGLTQELDAKFKKLNLDTMVKMFAGMSKAVDSDAERRAFEAAQPSITNDDQVNRRIFNDRMKDLEKLINKLEKANKGIAKDGAFVETEEESTEQQTSPSRPTATTNKPSWAK